MMSLLGFLVFLFSMSGVFVVVLKCVCVGRGGGLLFYAIDILFYRKISSSTSENPK